MEVVSENALFLCFDLVDSTAQARQEQRSEQIADFILHYLRKMEAGFFDLINSQNLDGGRINLTGDGGIYYISNIEDITDIQWKAILNYGCQVVFSSSTWAEEVANYDDETWNLLTGNYNSALGMSIGRLYSDRIGETTEFVSNGINAASKISGYRDTGNENMKNVFVDIHLYCLMSNDLKKCFNSAEIGKGSEELNDHERAIKGYIMRHINQTCFLNYLED